MKASKSGSKRPVIKPRLGDIVAIPLSADEYAFARLFANSEFGVFTLRSAGLVPLETLQASPIAFFQAAADDAVKSGDWPVIAHWPFSEGQDSWAPPKATWYIRDLNQWTVGSPRVTHRDQVLPATLQEVAGMDIYTFCQTPELLVRVIRDRLVDGNHAPYRVPGA